jgi:hypothetical protein
MVKIAIIPAAFQAIVARLPGNVGVENQRDSNGDYFIWLAHDVLGNSIAYAGRARAIRRRFWRWRRKARGLDTPRRRHDFQSVI